MGAVYFYHLTRAPLAQTLPMLLEKSLQAGWRVVVRGPDDGMMQALDLALWKGADDSFLPHGLAGGAHDGKQPVLLGPHVVAEDNDASCLMSVGGATVTAEEIEALDRVCILFDGLDDMALNHARQQWKSLTGAGCAAQYWSEESGRWEKKAETGG